MRPQYLKPFSVLGMKLNCSDDKAPGLKDIQYFFITIILRIHEYQEKKKIGE